jgi:hypothetical protein
MDSAPTSRRPNGASHSDAEVEEMSPSMGQVNLFLVSSALRTRFGVFDYASRVQQTLETCLSIAERTTADIILIDGGQEVPGQTEIELLRRYAVELVSFAQDANVRGFQATDNHDVVKNGVELYMYTAYLKSLYETGLYRRYSRIYKISGRYVLNDDFDPEFHQHAAGKFVVSSPRPSQFRAEVTRGVSYQRMSRLWSCDSRNLDYVLNIYQTMLADFVQTVNSGGYIDIEHLLYKHLAPDFVVSPASIGVTGMLAPNGVAVID